MFFGKKLFSLPMVKIVENLCRRIFNVFVIEYECCASCVVGKRLGHHLFSLVLFPPPILAMGHSKPIWIILPNFDHLLPQLDISCTM